MEAGHDRARREGDSDFTSFLKSQQNIVTPKKANPEKRFAFCLWLFL